MTLIQYFRECIAVLEIKSYQNVNPGHTQGKTNKQKISLKKPQNFGLSVLQMTPRHLRVECLPMCLTCATYLKQLMVQNLRKLFAVEVLLLMVPLERAYSTMLS